jgi:hypothetical protein
MVGVALRWCSDYPMVWMTNEFGFNSQQRSDYVLYSNKTSLKTIKVLIKLKRGLFPKYKEARVYA